MFLHHMLRALLPRLLSRSMRHSQWEIRVIDGMSTFSRARRWFSRAARRVGWYLATFGINGWRSYPAPRKYSPSFGAREVMSPRLYVSRGGGYDVSIDFDPINGANPDSVSRRSKRGATIELPERGVLRDGGLEAGRDPPTVHSNPSEYVRSWRSIIPLKAGTCVSAAWTRALGGFFVITLKVHRTSFLVKSQSEMMTRARARSVRFAFGAFRHVVYRKRKRIFNLCFCETGRAV